MQTIKNTFSKWLFQIALWLLVRKFGGYPSAEKEAFRIWFLGNLQRNALPIVMMTDVTWDDDLLRIVQSVVENDASWDIAWDMFRNGEEIPDGTINGTETGLLFRIRERISRRRTGQAKVGFSDEKEAESVTLAVLIISAIANGPLALKNIKALVERIKNRRNNE